ncbi:MAG: HNH endonuclease [Chlamydiae bacterium]|nr:HNH endonuclease [Chlamydiota bacterium]
MKYVYEEYPEIKIPEGIKETQYPGYYIGVDGKAYRAPGKNDRNTKLNEYGLIPLNTHLRGNPAHKKYQYPSINITLRDENGNFLRQKKANIHRLVAETFIPNPHNYDSVDHKDRNKMNNHVSNLRWCSIEDNKGSWKRTDDYLRLMSKSLRKDTVYGIGINDSDIFSCNLKNYKRWEKILLKCKREGKTICEDWKVFSKFNSWVESQSCDDSILYLIQGNEYCPENCVLTTYSLLNILSFKKNGKYPIGVSLSNPKTMKSVRYNSKTKQAYLGSYDTMQDAHLAWQQQKIKEIDLLITDEKDDRILEVLNKVKTSIQSDISNQRETVISPFIV